MSADADRPRYVAIITDGNGRWARQHGVSVAAGHNAGADTVKARLRDAVELGVRELTVYSFSTENWSRPASEVKALMRMFSRRIKSETPELNHEGVRMRFIGRREGVSAPLARKIAVRFDSNVAGGLPWKFEPEKTEIELRIGEVVTVYYTVTNLSARTTTAASGVTLRKAINSCSNTGRSTGRESR